MSDIKTIIIFKRDNGKEFIFDDRYVHLKALSDDILIFRFEAPQEILKEGEEFFNNLNAYEQISVDIGGTGNIPCYFKTVSPIVGKGPQVNGKHINGLFTVALQEIKSAPDPEEEQNCMTCSLLQNRENNADCDGCSLYQKSGISEDCAGCSLYQNSKQNDKI